MKKLFVICMATILALSLVGCSSLSDLKDEAIEKINENIEEQKENINNILDNPMDVVKISSIIEQSEVNLISTYPLNNGKDAYIFDVALEEETIYNINLIYMNEDEVHLIGHNDDKTHYLFLVEVEDIKGTITVEASYPGLSNVTIEREFGRKSIEDVLSYYPMASQYLETYCSDDEDCKKTKYETGIINIGSEYYFVQENKGIGTIGRKTNSIEFPSCYKLVYLSGIKEIDLSNLSFSGDTIANVKVISDNCSSLKNDNIKSWNRCLGLNIENNSNINVEEIINDIQETGVIEFRNNINDKYLLPLK